MQPLPSAALHTLCIPRTACHITIICTTRHTRTGPTPSWVLPKQPRGPAQNLSLVKNHLLAPRW